MGLTDQIAAYCFDRAVYLFGSAYDADIHDASMPPPGSKGKHNAARMVAMTNARWMDDDIVSEKKDDSQFEVVVDEKYRDPADRFARG